MPTGTYEGVPITDRSTYQKLTSAEIYIPRIRFACWTKTPFTRAVAAEGYGVESLQSLEQFHNATPTGRIIRMDSGKYQITGSIFNNSATTYHSGRMTRRNPQLIEGGAQFAYAWHQLNAVAYAPVIDVDDNAGGPIDILMHKMQVIQNQLVQDFNYALLGHASGPDYGTLGPSAVYSDLPNLISVTQTTGRDIGGIDRAETYWINGYTAITSVGGGHELDRPINLRRKMLKRSNTQMTYGESTGPQDYMILTTQGGHQYYDRLSYADALTTGKGDFSISTRYDAAGVQAQAFNGAPMIWDPAVTVPIGATASTEAFYGIHIPNFLIGIRKEHNFKWSGWEMPRQHDEYDTMVGAVSVRYTPGVVNRRPHWVCYNIPSCPD